MPRKSLTRPLDGLRLGCHLVPHEPVLRFGDYFSPHVSLPTPPEEFGHDDLVADWGMLGNDEWGDCAVAGPYHAEMLWNAEAKRPFPIDTTTVVESYADIAGVDIYAEPGNPTDKGCDPHDVALYWQNHGLSDHSGNLHKISGFIDLTPGNLTELWLGIYLFGAAGICVEMPLQWQQAFRSGETWDAVDKPDIVGGHYVLGVSRRDGNIAAITWGNKAFITPAGYKQFNLRTLVYVSEEMLVNGKSLEGFNIDQLRADLRALPAAA